MAFPGGGPLSARSAKFGRFIQTYHGFLSSFIIGVAGLVATSIWQYRQSQIAAQQAASEQAIARTKAENDWRIARAEILSKNLNVLSTQGPGAPISGSACCCRSPAARSSIPSWRSRTRSSSARTTRATCGRCWSTGRQELRAAGAGVPLTCLQRYGVEKAAEICKDDALSERSDAIAQLVQDEMEATAAAGAPPGRGR